MTREELIKNWECIVAFKEGKTIQWYDNILHVWRDAESPDFYKDTAYRIKPEPKTYYILWSMSDAVWSARSIWYIRKLAEEAQREYYSEVPTKITEVLEPIDD